MTDVLPLIIAQLHTESTDHASSNGLAIAISAFALVISVVGWFIIYVLNIRATNIDRKNNFQLDIYQALLEKSNELIKMISDYTTSVASHTNKMAKVLGEYHSYIGLPESRESIDAAYQLRSKWLHESHELAEKSFKLQMKIEDYMRYLDMNGTDYTSGTIVYNSLLKVKVDAYEAAHRNRGRWNDHRKMDEFTSKSYDQMSSKTIADASVISEFGECIEDVLIMIYNQSIATVLGKPSKEVNLGGARRIITQEGILDNRTSNEDE